MFVYFLTSELFKGQQRRIVTSWPVKDYIIESFANLDNAYPEDGKWKLVNLAVGRLDKLVEELTELGISVNDVRAMLDRIK